MKEKEPFINIRIRKEIATIAAISAGVLGFVALGAAELDHTDPEATFKRAYVDDGKCLDKTPFDPANRASVHYDENADTLLVVPRHPNAYDPPVLVLDVHLQGFESPTFSPDDSETARLLANCR